MRRFQYHLSYKFNVSTWPPVIPAGGLAVTWYIANKSCNEARSKQHQAGLGDPPATTANSTGFYACPSPRAICDLIGRIGRFGRAGAPVDFPFFDGLPDSSRETSIPVEAVEVLHHRVVRLGDCFLLVAIPFAR